MFWSSQAHSQDRCQARGRLVLQAQDLEVEDSLLAKAKDAFLAHLDKETASLDRLDLVDLHHTSQVWASTAVNFSSE